MFIITLADIAHAEGKFSLSADVSVVEHPCRDYDIDIYPVPVVSYEGDNFWFHGLGGGYYLWNDITDKLLIIAYWSSPHSKTKDSGDHQMRHLDGCKNTMTTGLSHAHFTQYSYLCTTLTGDILDNSSGIVWDMVWLRRYTSGGLTMTPGTGVQQNSKNQNEYYYDVSYKESARSSLRGYNLNDSWNLYLELNASYNFLGDWSVYDIARYTRLSDEAIDSLMVDKPWTGLISTGITYEF